MQDASPEIMQQFEADAHPEVIIAMVSALRMDWQQRQLCVQPAA